MTSSAAQTAPVAVAEVTAERDVDEAPEIPWHITPAEGRIALQLRSTVRRVSIGAGLARNADLVERIRLLPGVPAVATSPAGGTFIVGGEAWLGLCAIGVPSSGEASALDWMLRSLHRWFEAALTSWGITTTVGRVDGAWCPGFSDLAVDGRKLAGLGFRITKDWVVMRGVLAVQPMSTADLDVLTRCHRLIAVEVRGQRVTSLAEASGRLQLTVPEVIDELRWVATT